MRSQSVRNAMALRSVCYIESEKEKESESDPKKRSRFHRFRLGVGPPRLRPVRTLTLRAGRRKIEGAWYPDMRTSQTRLLFNRHKRSYKLSPQPCQAQVTSSLLTSDQKERTHYPCDRQDGPRINDHTPTRTDLPRNSPISQKNAISVLSSLLYMSAQT